MLTRKQHELLLYIHKHLSKDGVSPSFDEMKDALGLRSKSGIHRLITGLEERGFIRRLPHRARAVEVLRLPEDLARQGALKALRRCDNHRRADCLIVRPPHAPAALAGETVEIIRLGGGCHSV